MRTIVIRLFDSKESSAINCNVTVEDFFRYIDELFFCDYMKKMLFGSSSFESDKLEADKLEADELEGGGSKVKGEGNDPNLKDNLREKRLAKFSYLADSLPVMEKLEEKIKEKPVVDPNLKYGGTLPIWAEMNPRTVKLREELLKKSGNY